MTEQEKRLRRVCFTGHRPEKLTRGTDAIRQDLEREIRRSIADGRNVFVTGMARGVDIWAAQIVLSLRQERCPVKLMCVCPYHGFEKTWAPEWQEAYRAVLASADHVKYIRLSYDSGCFQARNYWMVDHVAQVIAVYNDNPGGTRNTIAYARQVGVPVIRIPG